MANPAKEHKDLLRRHRFVLVSENRHRKYKDPQGRVYIVSKTPSDWWAWRNALTTLKRVIASPVPSSELLEEERQRRELEASIVLEAQRKPPAGISGAGRSKKSKGTGFIYEEKIPSKGVVQVTLTIEELAAQEERQRKAQAKVEREEAERKERRARRRANKEWNRQLSRFRKGMRTFAESLDYARKFLRVVMAVYVVRATLGRRLRELPKPERRNVDVAQSVALQCAEFMCQLYDDPSFAGRVDETVNGEWFDDKAVLLSHSPLPHWMDFEALDFPTSALYDAQFVRHTRRALKLLEERQLSVPDWLVRAVWSLRRGENRIFQPPRMEIVFEEQHKEGETT